ncbi:hypothetical protein FDZ71_09150 [bacterium]|nr:MAG: hypothetical protein FDZ71_09150 [bacterium]
MKRIFPLVTVMLLLLSATPAFCEEGAATQEEVKALKGQLLAMQKKYDLLKEGSENVQTLIEERDSLSEEKIALSHEAEDLRARMGERENSSRIKWFLAGAAIFGVGWIMGAAGGKKRRGSPYY